jgi:hypothetical protein
MSTLCSIVIAAGQRKKVSAHWGVAGPSIVQLGKLSCRLLDTPTTTTALSPITVSNSCLELCLDAHYNVLQ